MVAYRDTAISNRSFGLRLRLLASEKPKFFRVNWAAFVSLSIVNVCRDHVRTIIVTGLLYALLTEKSPLR